MNDLIRAQPSACCIPEAEALMEGACAGGREPTSVGHIPLGLCFLTQESPACPCFTAWVKGLRRSQGQ